MKDNYLSFNSWALQYYIERSSLEDIGTLAIEVTEINNYCKENDCDLKFNEINNEDWCQLLLRDKVGIPKYFGLIAIQCYAASLMESDGQYSPNIYQARLVQITGIASIQSLQNFFKAEVDKMTIQEKLWIEAKDYLSSRGVIIKIPDVKSFRGKYIQYPLKQVVLNREDLKEYYEFYKKVDSTFEVISINEFKKFFHNENMKCIFKRKNNLIADNNRTQTEIYIKLKQIFDFYCSENWRNIKIQIAQAVNLSKDFILIYKELGIPKIQLYDSDYNVCSFIDLPSSHRKSGVLFFRKSEEFENEYDLTNYLEENNEYAFAANTISSWDVILKSNEQFQEINYSLSGYSFFKTKIDLKGIVPELLEYIKTAYPIELIGIKLSRKKQFLLKYPPIIANKSNVRFSIYFEGNRLAEYQPTRLHVGNYQIRVTGFSNLNFELIDTPKLDSIVMHDLPALKLSSLNTAFDYDIQGLNFVKRNIHSQGLTINSWIAFHIKGNKENKGNKILKALIQSNYGK